MNNSNVSLSIYGCGGTGINISNSFANAPALDNIPPMNIFYADTSFANIRRRNVPNENTYVIPNLDGSGGRRDENYHQIDQHIPSMLERLPPSNFNVVVFSGGGGSGSVIGPLLASAIHALGKKVIIMMVGSYESERRCTNTINTLATLNSIGKTNRFSPVVVYDSNGNQTMSETVDENMILCMSALARLTSGNYERLDNKDVENFFDPSHTVGLEPELLLLDIATQQSIIADIEYPVAVASIIPNDSDFNSISAEYNCEGLYSGDEGPLFFAIHNSGLSGIIQELKEQDVEFKRRKSARSRAMSTNMDGLGKGDQNGMVL